MSRATRSFQMSANEALSITSILNLDLEDIFLEVALKLDKGDVLDLIRVLLETVDDMAFTERVKNLAKNYYEEQEVGEEDDAP